MKTFPGKEVKNGWKWNEPASLNARQLRAAIAEGHEVLLEKRPGGYLISGDLRLDGLAASARVLIHGATFTGRVDCSDARFASVLDLRGCVFQRDLVLERARVAGPLWLDCAEFAPGAHLRADGLHTDGLCSADGLWLRGGDFCAANASIGGDLRLSSAELHGRLEMPYARIHGALVLSDTEKESEKTPVPARPFSLPTQAEQDERSKSNPGSSRREEAHFETGKDESLVTSAATGREVKTPGTAPDQQTVPAQTWIAGRVNLLSLHLTGQLEGTGIRLDEGLILQGANIEDCIFLRPNAVTRRITAILRANGEWSGQSVSLWGAKVKGGMELQVAKLKGALNLISAEIGGYLICSGAEIGAGQEGDPCSGVSVCLMGAKVKGQVHFEGADLQGALIMQSADIEGGVFCQSTTEHRTEIKPGLKDTDWAGQSVSLMGAKVKGQVDFSGADLQGALIMQGADIEGGVRCESTKEHRTEIKPGPGGYSVSLSGAKVKGEVNFMGADLQGALNMEKAETGSVFCRPDEESGQETAIGGNVLLYGAVIAGSFQWQDVMVGGEFCAKGLAVHGMFLASGLAVGGALDLTSASVTEQLDLDGVIAAGGADLSHLQLKGKLSTKGALLGGKLDLTHAEVGGEWTGAPAGVVEWIDAWSTFRAVDDAKQKLMPCKSVAAKAAVAHASAKNEHGQLREMIRAEVTVRRRHLPADSRPRRTPADRASLKESWSRAVTNLKKTAAAWSEAIEALDEAKKEKETAIRKAVAKHLTGQDATRIEEIPLELADRRRDLQHAHRSASGANFAQESSRLLREQSALEAELEKLQDEPALDLRHAEFKGRILLGPEGGTPGRWVIAGSVNAQRLKAGGDVRLQHARVRGSLVLEDAHLEGELNLNGSEVGANLNLRSATVKGQLFGPLEEAGISPQVHGEVRMDSATLSEVKLRLVASSRSRRREEAEGRDASTGEQKRPTSKGGYPDAESSEAAEAEASHPPCITPTLVSLEHAKVDRLIVGGHLPTTEEPHFKLAGLEFKDLHVGELEDCPRQNGKPSARRSPFRWLERSQYEILLAEMEDFEEEPYHAMEKWLRSRGRDDDADHVYLAMRRRELQLHPLTVWQRLYRKFTGRPKVELPTPPKNVCRWLALCPLVPPYNRPPMRMGWMRWGMNWFLLRTVGFGVRTRTATIAGLVAFLFSWLCVFNIPESAEFKGSRRIDSLPERVFAERAAEWGRTNRLAETNLVTTTNAVGLAATNRVIAFTRVPSTNDIAAKAKELRKAFEDEPAVLNMGAKRVSEWKRTEAFWLSMQIHVPLVHLMARDQYQPSDHPATFGHARTNRPPDLAPAADGRWQLLPPRRAAAAEKEPSIWALDFESYAALMQLLSYIFVPLIIASAGGWLKKH